VESVHRLVASRAPKGTAVDADAPRRRPDLLTRPELRLGSVIGAEKAWTRAAVNAANVPESTDTVSPNEALREHGTGA